MPCAIEATQQQDIQLLSSINQTVCQLWKQACKQKQAFFKTLGISSVIKFDRFVKMYCEIQLGNGFEWMKEEQTAQSDKIWNQQSYLVNNDFIHRMNKNVVDQYFTI